LVTDASPKILQDPLVFKLATADYVWGVMHDQPEGMTLADHDRLLYVTVKTMGGTAPMNTLHTLVMRSTVVFAATRL